MYNAHIKKQWDTVVNYGQLIPEYSQNAFDIWPLLMWCLSWCLCSTIEMSASSQISRNDLRDIQQHDATNKCRDYLAFTNSGEKA